MKMEYFYKRACHVVAIVLSFLGNSRGQDTAKGVVTIQRGIDTDILLDNITGAKTCDFTGTITLGGPFSLEKEDKFSTIGSKQLVSFQLMVDFINRFRCGVNLNGQQYAIVLKTFDDQSSGEWTAAIARQIVSNNMADILLGGYSSGLTEHVAKVANETDRLLMAPGAASTSVFSDRNNIFGSFPPTSKYLAQAVKGLASVGAKTIATIYEDASFTRGVCTAAPDLADTHKLEVTSTQQVVASPSVEDLEDVAKRLEAENPDVVITCVYDGGCTNWMKAMRKINWSPKAQVFTVCVGLHSFTESVGTDSQYIFGVTPWDSSLDIEDEVTKWSAKDFGNHFREKTSDLHTSYHAASAASIISILVQALEKTNSLDNSEITKYIATNSFKTIYGDISFDANGQSQAPALLIQYDTEGVVQTIFPEATRSGPFMYPMPTWDGRDCALKAPCTKAGDTCSKAGKCVCADSDSYSVGAGATAQCIPEEDMGYISPTLKSFVNVLAALVIIMALGAIAWTYHYRENPLVKASQPFFLALIIGGSIISSLSIVFMGMETGYPESSDDIKFVNGSCMAVYWLWGLGFTLTFSALFAKILRVKKLLMAKSFEIVQVPIKDVVYIILFVLFIEFGILFAFQISSPHIWYREVLDDINGYSIESAGSCTSENGWPFVIALVAINVLFLLYTLILCFQARNIPDEFAETRDIFLAVIFDFQVLSFAAPFIVMARNDPQVNYFIRAATVFLQNFTVLVVIFVQKMLRVYHGVDTKTTVRKSIREHMKSRIPLP
mmetsp:Transcript_2644/g.5503  ORF Transcript_2644/g.5503 Transcript_2644/m.5503 type:complete len:780 (+) Transcript_2644:240-2579(+)|eukprot:CAMPEP_0194327920 /NCGR_PEP_ID=MMETSP0171-20130528/42959_1 /TAXON_ID=218684 /ORGANISM="Corethron pennatum, Strain L29A3" /LENGTH=779 /DNA_ID=CAMNT_0039088033 /DNA_START=106 /DNA_END=2445 /DNA_ORIENTATION=-